MDSALRVMVVALRHSKWHYMVPVGGAIPPSHCVGQVVPRNFTLWRLDAGWTCWLLQVRSQV